MGFLRSAALALLGLLLAASIFSAIVANSLRMSVLDANALEAKLQEAGAFSAARDAAAQILSEKLSTETGVSSSEVKAEVSAALEEIITDEWAAKQSHSLLSNLLAYLKGETNELTLTVSIKELKPTFAAIAEKRLVKIAGNYGDGLGIAGMSELAATAAKQQAEALAESLPDEIDLAQRLPKESLAEARSAISTFILASYALIVACIMLAILIAIVAEMRVKKVSKHFGWPLVLAGCAGLVFSSILPNLLANQGITVDSTTAANAVALLGLKIASAVLQGALSTMATLSATALALGVILLAASFLIKEATTSA